MNEQELAIPFDIKAIHESLLLRISHKLKNIVITIITRILDIILSLFGIIFLIPFAIIVYFQNLKNKDYGPVFYTQERIGKNGKLFKMYKFRTMVNNADKILDAMLQDEEIRKEYETYRKIENDPRITRFGRILRRTSLDEFPQFINILKGEMSVVGPRPYLPDEKEKMSTYYKYIVQHKPGLTGVYQITGKARVEFIDRLDIDMRYHYSKSVKQDLKIALITMIITLRRKNTFNSIGELLFDTADYILKNISLIFKRIIDILGAIVGILLLIPISIGIFIGNKICKDKGPLFLVQDRIGKNGKVFKMYKFRSMVLGADEILLEMLAKDENMRTEYETYKKLKNDPRITKVGKFIRKTSLDEFPQFINILKGEMSLVGPRAYLVREKEDMGEAYETIVQVKPGLTGPWQVNGRSDVTFNDRLEMDIDYYDSYNLGQDIEILFKTVLTVLRKKGAA